MRKMKKFISLILLISMVLLPVFAQEDKLIYSVHTGNQNTYMDAAGLTEKKSANPNGKRVNCNFDYHDSRGIDAVARENLTKLKALSEKPSILMGLSLGGAVSQRMAQLSDEYGVELDGYVAISSPLQGNRLTDPVWATTAMVGLASHLVLTAAPTFSSFMAGSIYSIFDLNMYKSDEERNAGDIIPQDDWSDETKKLASVINGISAKSVNRSKMTEQELIEQYAMPYVDALFGNGGRKGTEVDYILNCLSQVIANPGTIHDLNPLGAYMKNTNDRIQLDKEAGLKRVFLRSQNGNIFETSVWETVGPVVSFTESRRDYYWSIAKSQWWLFGVYAAISGTYSLSAIGMNNTSQVWSWACSGDLGDTGYLSHDCFVQSDDEFWGKKLSMVAADYGKRDDTSIDMQIVSHVDYSHDYNTLKSKRGRSGSRAAAANKIRDSIAASYNLFLED
jgi:hypothetical protein